jgi:iron complex outermembrane receptor protein
MNGMETRGLWLPGIAGLALAAANAAAAATGDVTQAQEIIVTGTRVTGLRADESLAPIQVQGAELLKRTGQPDLIQSLAQNTPSLQAQTFGSDMEAFHLSMKLRGLNPNHTLVLINGKRRHGTANVVVSGGAYGGNAAADIGLIPVAQIERLEILQDGAAAQYGTDAIAGVINIILKDKSGGGAISSTAGQYMDGGGRTGQVAINVGLAPVPDSYLNLTLETKYHGFSFRGDIDPRVSPLTAGGSSILTSFPQAVNAPNYPYVNRVAGDAEYRMTTLTYNAGYQVTKDLTFYSFGSGTYRWGQAYENYRLPNVVLGKMASDVPFPMGFSPKESIEETDHAFTVGAKGAAASWKWDLATTYGHDLDKVYVLSSANASLYADTLTTTSQGFSPHTFYDGSYKASQWTSTLDLAREFDVGLAEPLNLAVGSEYRREMYGIVAGDTESYYKTGAQSFLGYAPVNAGVHHRTVYAAYVDLAADVTNRWKVDAALRYEHYSDFGHTTVAKLTSRYDFSDAIAVRGTVSTGFRAPTLAEAFYSGINVGPTSVSGVFAPNSPGAAFLGVSGLRPEKSKNYSLGFVARAYPGLTMTLDLYQITIRDRIVQSGNFYGYNSNSNVIQSPSVIQALQANGVVIDPSIFTASSGSVSVLSFVNGMDTRNRGADFAVTYAEDFDRFGRVDWSLSANYNELSILKINAPPSNVDQRVTLLDSSAQASLTTEAPRWRFIGSAFWVLGKFSVNLRESFYSSSRGLSQNPVGAFQDTVLIKSAFTTDLEFAHEARKGVRLSIGANNLFNHYPTKEPAAYRAAQLATNSSAYASSLYPSFAPYGRNGGYYYVSLDLSF